VHCQLHIFHLKFFGNCFDTKLLSSFSFVKSSNRGDLMGRLLAGWISTTSFFARFIRPNLSAKLVIATCVRCLFLPLFLLCVGGKEHATSNDLNGYGDDNDYYSHSAQIRIHSDAYSFLVQAGLALSYGFLVTLAFMLSPTLVSGTTAQEKSSEILTLSLSLGLLVGSLLSFPITKLATE